ARYSLLASSGSSSQSRARSSSIFASPSLFLSSRIGRFSALYTSKALTDFLDALVTPLAVDLPSWAWLSGGWDCASEPGDPGSLKEPAAPALVSASLTADLRW